MYRAKKQKGLEPHPWSVLRLRSLFVFNYTIGGLRAPAVKPGRVTQADKLGEGL